MSTVATTEVSKKYSEKFDNFAELAYPPIVFLPAFGDLLQKAIDRNSPLTDQEVQAAFGPLEWEEQIDDAPA
jgi:hypothetical protein